MTLNKALNEYSNLLLAENLNINTLRLNSDSSNHLSDLNDAFSLSNLVQILLVSNQIKALSLISC